jgi:hypothetical protein
MFYMPVRRASTSLSRRAILKEVFEEAAAVIDKWTELVFPVAVVRAFVFSTLSKQLVNLGLILLIT